VKIRYEIFEQLKNTTILTEEQLKNLTALTEYEDGYQKFIQTGGLDIYDYGRGFLSMLLYHKTNRVGKDTLFLYLATVDDGAYATTMVMPSREETMILIKEIALEVFAVMVSFPSLKELNKMISKYGLNIPPL